jgi:1,2-diacylglycerol 3-alpha-glucosyltransferase
MSQSRISESVLLGKPYDSFAGPFPKRLGILNDYVRVPYANGSSFASQLLYREFSQRGHEVSVVGPRDRAAKASELPRRHVELPSVPVRMHPGVHMPFPSREALATVAAQNFDLVLGQTNTGLMNLGIWLRRTRGVPMLCVNTVHLASVYDVILPDMLHESERFKDFCAGTVVPFIEAQAASMYNESDGLIVLSEGLKGFWRERGVRVPIHVIPRCIDPTVFDGVDRLDPFPKVAKRGHRLLCICRHTREKSVSRLIKVFAELIAPAVPDATLTLVGDGPDHDVFRAEALELGVADRVFFPGEQGLADISGWYQHADVFVYASLSETYGQVISEALWSGLPVVAFEDGMGVSQQLDGGRNGILVPSGPDERAANWRFASEVAAFLRDPVRRQMFGHTARRLSRERSSVEVAIGRYYHAFESAREHCLRTRHGSRDRAFLPIARWAALHSITAALGTLRAPAVVNRNGQRQPGWDELELVD